MKIIEIKKTDTTKTIRLFGVRLYYRENTRRNPMATDMEQVGSHMRELDILKSMIGKQVLETRKLSPPTTIQDAELKVYSQWGDDGIIQWMISRIPSPNRTFVEFGVENYMESNTRFLLINNNWSGLVIDGSSAHVESIRNSYYYWRHDLTAISAFIDKDNINSLIKSRFTGEIGILSVDLDGNDYWILDEINCINPQIIICEINAVLGGEQAVTIPYDPKFEYRKAHESGLYFGASLKAMELLLKGKGYSLVGINSNAVNAFFIRNDLAGFFDATTTEQCFVYPKFSSIKDGSDESVTIRENTRKLHLIRDKILVDITTNKAAPISELFI